MRELIFLLFLLSPFGLQQRAGGTGIGAMLLADYPHFRAAVA
ncbi:hypothetical protein ACFQWH_05520 [Mycolicibacterium sp. GCM10028919]